MKYLHKQFGFTLQAGFTLIEMMVVVAVLAIVLSDAHPNLGFTYIWRGVGEFKLQVHGEKQISQPSFPRRRESILKRNKSQKPLDSVSSTE